MNRTSRLLAGADIVMRVLTPAVGEAVSQPLVIDNRMGAGRKIDTDLAAHASGAGYPIHID